MKHALHSPAPVQRKTTGRIILRAPEITPRPVSAAAPLIVTRVPITFQMIQVDLSAGIPDAAVDLVADPADAAGLITWPLVHSRREIEAAPHRDEYSREDFRLMASAVGIDHRGLRGLRPVTLLLHPDQWQDVETIAEHFTAPPLYVVRAALRIALERKLATIRPHPLVTATRGKAGR